MRETDKTGFAKALVNRLMLWIGLTPKFKDNLIFKGPVGWMLDRQLITSLREMFFYDAFGSQIDPRNWMTGNEVDRSDGFSGQAYWFDYLSDSGDGMRATYSIAYLAQSNLYVAASSKAGADVAFDEGPAHPSVLPRGDFLFVGGDTSYHVANFETLTERFQTPFNVAYRELDEAGKLHEPKRRPILGIPGNHDYYDFLDGFNRQFRLPYSPEPDFSHGNDPDAPQLALEGFERKQTASFVSIKLPFGWRMWGMDTHEGKLDRRQKNFFSTIAQGQAGPPEKLIVATPEPLVAFGKSQSKDGAYVKTFSELGLPPQFVGKPGSTTNLPPTHCRLDLAGDVHHYARYGGAVPGAPQPANYASVISGLGGAFLHSSSTDTGEVPSAARYPSPRTSLREILGALLAPWTVLRGGRLWLTGLLVTGLIYVGIVCSPSLNSALQPLLAGTAIEVPVLKDSAKPEGADLVALSLWSLAGSLEVPRQVCDRTDPAYVPSAPGARDHCEKKGAAEQGHGLWHRELLFIPVLLVVLFVGLRCFRICNGRAAAEQATDAGLSGDKTVPSVMLYSPIWFLVATAIATVFWVYRPGDYAYAVFHPLASSFILLTTLVAAYLAFRWCNAYDEAMNRRSRKRGSLTVADHAHAWLLWAIAVLIPIFGVARYGVDSLAVMAIDMGFLLIVIGILVGLPLFAMMVGGTLHGVAGKIGFLLLGIWHALLQLCFPLLIAFTQPASVGLTALLTTAAVAWTLSRLLPGFVRQENADGRKKMGIFLLGAWLLWSALTVALVFQKPTLQPVSWESLGTALLLGSALSCIWFGWYLAVAICFDGHNNEAGGGSRIEDYKQFIRFRLTQESLTGYVIAVDCVEREGTKLKPKLVDVFELRHGQPPVGQTVPVGQTGPSGADVPGTVTA